MTAPCGEAAFVACASAENGSNPKKKLAVIQCLTATAHPFEDVAMRISLVCCDKWSSFCERSSTCALLASLDDAAVLQGYTGCGFAAITFCRETLRNGVPLKPLRAVSGHPSASMVNERDLLSSETSRSLWTQVGNNVVIHNAHVSTSAVAYEIK